MNPARIATSYDSTLQLSAKDTFDLHTFYLLGTNNMTRLNFISQLVHAPILSNANTDIHPLNMR